MKVYDKWMTNAKWCENLTLPLARWAKDHMINFLLQKFYCETTPMSALHNIEHFVTKHNDVQNRNRFISKKNFSAKLHIYSPYYQS
jgi:uncharacterized protein (DUF2384 family)